VQHAALFEVILREAKAFGLRGATVWRGIEGFGVSGQVHTNRFPDANDDLPVIIELIDAPEQIDLFLSSLTVLTAASLVTKESVLLVTPSAP
jgi:PII-like signaling protein